MILIFYFLLFVFLIYSWKLLIVDFLGDSGNGIVLAISSIIIFTSLPLYLIEFILTGWEFKKSVSGVFFFYSSCSFMFFIISGFLLNNLLDNKSFIDKLFKKKNLI